MVISAYSKSSNSSGFDSILQKFCEMICEVIVYKTVGGIFLIFCQSSFITNFIVKNHFFEPLNHRNLNNSRPIYFKKFSAHCFANNFTWCWKCVFIRRRVLFSLLSFNWNSSFIKGLFHWKCPCINVLRF